MSRRFRRSTGGPMFEAGTLGASLADRNEEHLLELLSGAGHGLTVAAMLARGIRAPAQTVYELQLAGHPIARVDHVDQAASRTVAYRLQRPAEV